MKLILIKVVIIWTNLIIKYIPKCLS